jgi:hypothetical protein
MMPACRATEWYFTGFELGSWQSCSHLVPVVLGHFPDIPRIEGLAQKGQVIVWSVAGSAGSSGRNPLMPFNAVGPAGMPSANRI